MAAADPAILVKVRVRCGELFALGPGKAALLEAVDQCRSISEAGRRLGYSYAKTRHLVDDMNHCFKRPVVTTMKGGYERGGAELTPLGREALELYRRLEAKAEAAVQGDLAAVAALLAGEEAAASAPPRTRQERRSKE